MVLPLRWGDVDSPLVVMPRWWVLAAGAEAEGAVGEGEVHANAAAAVGFAEGDGDFEGLAPELAGADGFFAGFDGEGDAFDGIHHGAAGVPGIWELALAVVGGAGGVLGPQLEPSVLVAGDDPAAVTDELEHPLPLGGVGVEDGADAVLVDDIAGAGEVVLLGGSGFVVHVAEHPAGRGAGKHPEESQRVALEVGEGVRGVADERAQLPQLAAGDEGAGIGVGAVPVEGWQATVKMVLCWRQAAIIASASARVRHSGLVAKMARTPASARAITTSARSFGRVVTLTMSGCSWATISRRSV